MDTYVILRRGGWRTADDLEEAADRSTSRARRCRTTSLDPQLRHRGARRHGRNGLHLPGVEPGGDPAHASRADLPVDEIVKVADTVIVRPDPVPVEA